MSSNLYLIEEKATLLQNKLAKMTESLSDESSFQTQEEIITEIIRVLTSFYKDMAEPITKIETIMPGDLPDPELYNQIWDNILSDLTVVFLELENLEELTLSNFNFITTEANRLLARIKNVSSQLGDYILYSTNPTKNAIYFRDSFNDLSRIDVNSSLLANPQCDVDQDQGILYLPIDREKDSTVKITVTPTINAGSNGVIGNNQQIGAAFNGDPKAILDNNPDTWFEYERVLSIRSSGNMSDPLILDMTLDLGKDTIVNYIRINPNNFGTKNIVHIDTIETSLDSQTFTNIKDDIPIGDFHTQDEENIFTLAAATSKYAGQGIYSFTPRKARYIHLIFRQNEPYVIDTPQGEKLRYAIGIRDIEVKSYQFKPKGEFISNSFSLNDDIRKIALDANQNPIDESTLASIKYFISHDDGQTWVELKPKSFNGFANIENTVREVIDYNSSIKNSINTSIPVRNIRVKAVLERDDNAFKEGSSTLKKEAKLTSELHRLPETSPFEFELEKPPIEGTIEVIDPMYGSRGIPEIQYIIGHGSKNSPTNTLFYLPISLFKRAYKKESSGSPAVYTLTTLPISEYLHVFVGGEEWTHTDAALDTFSANSSISKIYRLFKIDPNKSTLQFGTGLDTMAPPVGSPISMYLEPERLFPTINPNDHVAQLDFKAPNDKSVFRIKRYEKETSTVQVLPRKATIIHLDHKNITDLGTIATNLNTIGLTTQVTFINGKDELTSSSKWSIDLDEGIVYLGTETPYNRAISISYSYQDIVELKPDDWDWANTDALRDSITIKDTGWKTIEVEEQYLPTDNGRAVFELPHMGIVKGTVTFDLLDGTTNVSSSQNPFVKEVPFVDGSIELGAEVTKIVERIPSLTIDPLTNIGTFDLTHDISTNTADHVVTFTNRNIFKTEDTSLNDVGDWKIDRDNGSATYNKVYVKLDSSSVKLGASYIVYLTEFINRDTNEGSGLYSIDYKKGRIFTQRKARGGNWNLTVSYQYTDYRAEYRIARILPTDAYEINRTDKTIKIKDSEVIKRATLPKDIIGNFQQYYQVNYEYVSETRENVEDLKNYFTPMIKDYAVKIITKGQLI